MFISDAQTVWAGVGIWWPLRDARGMVNRGSFTRSAIAEQEPIGFGAARGLSVDCPAKTNRMSSMVGTTYGIMDVTQRRIGEAAHLDAFSIAEFCARNGPISRALYY